MLMVFRDGAQISFALLLPAVLGVHLVSFIPLKTMAEKGNIYTKRLAYAQFVISLIGLFIGIVILLLNNYNLSTESGFTVILFFFIIRLSSILIFTIFLRPLQKLIKARLPDKPYKEVFELEQLGHARDMIPAMSLLQVTFHLRKLKSIVDKSFILTRQYLSIGEERSASALAKIKDYERIADNMYRELNSYLILLNENSLSFSQSHQVHNILSVASELEAIVDYLDKLASYSTKLSKEELRLLKKDDFFTLFDEVHAYYKAVTANLPYDSSLSNNEISALSHSLKLSCNTFKQEQLTHLLENYSGVVSITIYSDIVSCVRNIRGRVLKIYNA